MNTGRTVFAQLIAQLPHKEFQKCVARYRGDSYVILSRPTPLGSADPESTHSIRHATYCSSFEKFALQVSHAGTTGRSGGYGSSSRTLDGTWSLVDGGAPQYTQNPVSRSSGKSLRGSIEGQHNKGSGVEVRILLAGCPLLTLLSTNATCQLEKTEKMPTGRRR
jgi:hypothetical protein